MQNSSCLARGPQSNSSGTACSLGNQGIQQDELESLLYGQAWPDISRLGQDPAWFEILNSAALSAWDAHDPCTARRAWNRMYAVRSATLPDDHPYLHAAWVLTGNPT